MKTTALKLISALILTVITITGTISSLNIALTSNAEPVEIICPVNTINYGKCHIKLITGDTHVCIYTGITTNFCSQPQNSN